MYQYHSSNCWFVSRVLTVPGTSIRTNKNKNSYTTSLFNNKLLLLLLLLYFLSMQPTAATSTTGIHIVCTKQPTAAASYVFIGEKNARSFLFDLFSSIFHFFTYGTQESRNRCVSKLGATHNTRRYSYPVHEMFVAKEQYDRQYTHDEYLHAIGVRRQ